jgi:hypothetical protein
MSFTVSRCFYHNICAHADEYIEPQGLARLKEALEANDWGGGGGEEEDELHVSDLEGSDEEGSLDFGISIDEMKDEMAGMKQAIYGGGAGERSDEIDPEQDKEVEKLQAMMLKMQAVRGLFLYL